MGTLLFRQFPDHWQEEDIRRVFEGFGAIIRVLFVADRVHGKRLAFVDMDSPASATSAADALSGIEIEGVLLRAEAYRGVIGGPTSSDPAERPACAE